LITDKYQLEKLRKKCSLPTFAFEQRTREFTVRFDIDAEPHCEPKVVVPPLDAAYIVPHTVFLKTVRNSLTYQTMPSCSAMAFFRNFCKLSDRPQEDKVPSVQLEEVLRCAFAELNGGHCAEANQPVLLNAFTGERSVVYACAQRPETLVQGTASFTSPLLPDGEWVCMRSYHLLSVFAVSNWQTLKLHFTPFGSKEAADFYIFPRELCEFMQNNISKDFAMRNPTLPADQFYFTLQRNPCNIAWNDARFAFAPPASGCVELDIRFTYSVLPETLPSDAQPTIPELRDWFSGFCNTAEMKLDTGRVAEHILNAQN
jgi:hypothetical protein